MSKPISSTPNPEELWEASKTKTKLELSAKGITKPNSWEVVYATIDRWSLKDPAAVDEKAKLIASSDVVKTEIRDAARSVKKKTHEQINASSQAEFLIKVAIGEQVSTSGKHFERTAKSKTGDEISITRLAQGQRLRTAELPVRPELIQDIENVATKTADRDKYVLPGHTGATYFGKPSTSSQVVSSRGASSGKESIHQAQIDAMAQSSTHLGLSNRLSKVRDQFQENGTGILKAAENKGFHPESNWQGTHLDSNENVLVVAATANQIFKKAQTKEKKLRKPYEVPPNLSEAYQDIRTESETKTDDFPDYLQRKVFIQPEFKNFADKHKIDTTAKSFVDKAKALNAAVTKSKGRTQ